MMEFKKQYLAAASLSASSEVLDMKINPHFPPNNLNYYYIHVIKNQSRQCLKLGRALWGRCS